MGQRIIIFVSFTILLVAISNGEPQSKAPNFYNSYFRANTNQDKKVPGKENVAFENRYRQKFDEIFRAYSEGYKAAMMAMQARSVIPHPPENKASIIRKTKATIPRKPVADNLQQNVMKLQNPAGVINQIRSKVAINSPIPKELTVNAIEKSGIPRPILNALIARRKAQLLAKRNQVLSSPEAFSKAHPNPLAQFLKQQNGKNGMIQKRYQIPQFNYNDIDPNWYEEPRLPRQASEMTKETPHANLVQNAVKKNLALKSRRSSAPKTDRQRRSHAPYLGQNLDAFGIVRVEPHLDDKPAVKKAVIAKPKPIEAAVPQKQEQKRVEIPMPEQDTVFQPVMTERSEIPHAFEQTNIAESQVAPVSSIRVETEEEKRDKIARLNAAARHRNVYFDVMGGDPYGASSGVMSRNFIAFAKHRRRRHTMS